MKTIILTILILISFLNPAKAITHGILFIKVNTKVENEKILIDYDLEKLITKKIIKEDIQSAKLYIGEKIFNIVNSLYSLKFELPFEEGIQLSDCIGDKCNPEGYPYIKVVYVKGLPSKPIEEKPEVLETEEFIKEEEKEVKKKTPIDIIPVEVKGVTEVKEEILEEEVGIGGSNIVFFPIPNENTCTYDFKLKYLKSCTIQKPQIIEIENIKNNDTYTVRIKGTFNPSVRLSVDGKNLYQNAIYKVNLYINNRLQKEISYKKIDKHVFELTVITTNKYTSADITVSTELSTSFKYSKKWIDINKTSPRSNGFKVPKEKIVENKSNNLFSFPFKKVVGVTQWHGKTAFQNPHTGIDFGSVREPIYAIADGEIMEAKWDDYNGKCLSGGYFIKIKHSNGKYSVYLHLKDLNGRKKGNIIKKGDLLAYSGNSGVYNCQPLGYHLHFEIRNGDLLATHTNPVPHISIDWNTIPTLDAKKYPGRLSGENPHINF